MESFLVQLRTIFFCDEACIILISYACVILLQHVENSWTGRNPFREKKTTGWRELITIRKISFISGQRLFAVKKDTWKYRYRVILYNITVKNLLLRPFREFFLSLPFFPNSKTDVSEVWFVFCVVWRLTFKWRHDKSIFRWRVTFITSAYKHKDSHA